MNATWGIDDNSAEYSIEESNSAASSDEQIINFDGSEQLLFSEEDSFMSKRDDIDYIVKREAMSCTKVL